MALVQPRALGSLPTTTLSWLALRDHFVATVGPSAGHGQPMGPLLVLADATFAPRSRFPLHPHQEMEILSLVITGQLSHHGDQAHGATLGAREVQLISARSGITHAEGNETEAPTRMLQIWFRPTTFGGAPAYHQRTVGKTGRQIVAGDDVVPLRCDAKVWWLNLEPNRSEAIWVAAGRAGYLIALDGAVTAAGKPLAEGEGAHVRGGEAEVVATAPCSALWIDVSAT